MPVRGRFKPQDLQDYRIYGPAFHQATGAFALPPLQAAMGASRNERYDPRYYWNTDFAQRRSQFADLLEPARGAINRQAWNVMFDTPPLDLHPSYTYKSRVLTGGHPEADRQIQNLDHSLRMLRQHSPGYKRRFYKPKGPDGMPRWTG